jgi:hypothetical protein
MVYTCYNILSFMCIYFASGFILFLGLVWVLQETTKVRILRYIILFIGKCNSSVFLSILFSEKDDCSFRQCDGVKNQCLLCFINMQVL